MDKNIKNQWDKKGTSKNFLRIKLIEIQIIPCFGKNLSFTIL